MAEDITYCVRGCVSPCGCSACEECQQPIHPPKPRPADTGLLCKPDVDKIRRWLREIPDLYATLDPYEAPAMDEEREHHGKRAKLSGSPALVRLDVVALMDPRTKAGVPGDPWDGSIDIPGEMSTWAALLAEEHGIKGNFGTITEAAGLLARWLPELCASLWIDECYDALRDVYRLLQRAHGVQRPHPVGQCINTYERGGRHIACTAMLYANGTARIKCRACGAKYDGPRLLLVKRQAKADEAKGAGA